MPGYNLRGGAAMVSISPATSQFLAGYPHVARFSDGVHDPIYSSAVYLHDGQGAVLMVSCDVVSVPKALAIRARERIFNAVGVPPERVLIGATHTHSAPLTTKRHNRGAEDPAPKEPDPVYLSQLEDGIVEAATRAAREAEPVEIGRAIAPVEGVGTNRRSPDGPSDPAATVLAVRNSQTRCMVAVVIVYSMHPTVLHEDSLKVSADFPGMARMALQRHPLPPACPVLYFMGPAGNQSPRHCVRAQTFEEAERLGGRLADAVRTALDGLSFRRDISLDAVSVERDLPRREIPFMEDAEANLRLARERFERARCDGTDRARVRTLECDVFGAERTLALARSRRDGTLESALHDCLPAEIQILRLGSWFLAGWPGEFFVEYALAVRQALPETAVISCANGTLQGYIVTPEAAAAGGYEAHNAVFAPETGPLFVRETCALIKNLQR